MLNKGRGSCLGYTLETKKLSVMTDHASMDELFIAALEVERMLVELGEIPFNLLKEKQEEGAMANTIIEK
jgi:hypothetical protein